MHYSLPLFLLPALALGAPSPVPVTHIAVPGNYTVKNFCPYPVYVAIDYKGGWPDAAIVVPTWHRISGPLHQSPSCAGNDINACGGVSLKASKTPNGPRMQFEYLATEGTVYYDISLIDCINAPGGCAGHEAGYTAYSGEGCQAWTCPPGLRCDKNAYIEAAAKDGSNTAGCAADKGVAFNLCAYKT